MSQEIVHYFRFIAALMMEQNQLEQYISEKDREFSAANPKMDDICAITVTKDRDQTDEFG